MSSYQQYSQYQGNRKLNLNNIKLLTETFGKPYTLKYIHKHFKDPTSIIKTLYKTKIW